MKKKEQNKQTRANFNSRDLGRDPQEKWPCSRKNGIKQASKQASKKIKNKKKENWIL